MSSSGTIAIKKHNEVFIFETDASGYFVEDFAEQQSPPGFLDDLVQEARRFCGQRFRHQGRGYANVRTEPFNPEILYHDLAEYSVYYDGKQWHDNKHTRR